MGKQVFISYSRLDSAFVDKICGALDEAGISYFIDRKGIAGGMEFPAAIASAIKECDIFLFIGSANSYESKFTNAEITYAFNKKSSHSIIPYLIDSTPLPDALEFTFSAINWRTLADHPIPHLIDDLRILLDLPATRTVKDTQSLKDEMKDKQFICTICGYVSEGDSAPERCLCCGSPKHKFREIS